MDDRAKLFLCLLLASLAFSELVPSNAVAATRTGNIMVQEPQVLEHIPTRTSPVAAEGRNSGGEAVDARRMDVELNDYPGSGANNRHTPRPQFETGCTDC